MSDFDHCRVACLWLPEFALQVHRRQHKEFADQKLAIVDRDHPMGRILEVQAGASKSAVCPGMRYSQALSLDLELCCVVWDATAVAREHQAIGGACLDWTPDVEQYSAQDGVFWLFYSGMQRLYPDLRSWGQGVLDAVSQQGWQAKLAIGFGRRSSYAAVRCQTQALWVALDPKTELAQASNFSLQSLALSGKERARLLDLGIKDLGALWALPAGSLPDRFGQDLQKWHRMGNHEDWEVGERVAQEKQTQVCIELDHPVKRSQAVMARINDVLPTLCQEVFDRGHEISGVEIGFHVVATWGKAPAHLRCESIGLCSPGRDPAALLRLIALRLEGQPLSAAVERIDLRVLAAKAERTQGVLWASMQTRDLHEGEAALAVIRAELGNDAVQRAVLCDEHVPEHKFRWEPFVRLCAPTKAKPWISGFVRRIQAQAQALKERSIRGKTTVWGPFVLESDWWKQGVSRKEYYLKDEQGTLRWVFFDGEHQRWFFQGEVG